MLLLRGEGAAAETWLTEASELARSQDDRYFEAEVRRLSATCRAERGDIGKAVALLRGAIDVARTQGAATFELRAALNLAELEPREGRGAVRSAIDRIKEPEAWPEITAAHACLR